jgi:hypothetical protein
LFSTGFTAFFVSFFVASCFESLGLPMLEFEVLEFEVLEFEVLEFEVLEFEVLGRAIELASSPGHFVQFERMRIATDRKQTDKLEMVLESMRIRLI